MHAFAIPPVLHSAQLWSSPPSIPHSLRCNVCINPPASTFVMKLAIFYGNSDNSGNSNQKWAQNASFSLRVDIFRFELKSNLRPKPPHIPHSRQNSILPCFINLPYFFIFSQKRKALSNRDRVHLVRSGCGFVEPPTHTGLLNSDLVPHLLHDREQNSKTAFRK